jgi:hypothetical protein
MLFEISIDVVRVLRGEENVFPDGKGFEGIGTVHWCLEKGNERRKVLLKFDSFYDVVF